MRTMILSTSLGLACLLGAMTVARAADPGTEDPNNWPQYNRTANAWRYSPLDQINKENVSRLSVAWIAQGGDITMGIQETPLAIDGVIYSITSGDRVAALDGRTGQEIWRYEPRLDALTKKVLFAPYSRGVAVGHGMVFIGTVDGRGIALDQKTGKEKWQVQLTDFANCHGCNFTSPPVVAGDMLTFGSTAGELATQGKIFGVDAATGKKIWEFNTIKQDPKSWPGESGKYGGGGAWMPGTYDPNQPATEVRLPSMATRLLRRTSGHADAFERVLNVVDRDHSCEAPELIGLTPRRTVTDGGSP